MPHDFLSFFVCDIEKLNNHKFQASVTESCTSLGKRSGIFRQNPLKVHVKKLDLKVKTLPHMNFFASGFYGFR